MPVQTTPLEVRLTDPHAFRVSTKGGTPVFEVDTLTLAAALSGRFSAERFVAYRDHDAIEAKDMIRVDPSSLGYVLEGLEDGEDYARVRLSSDRLNFGDGTYAPDPVLSYNMGDYYGALELRQETILTRHHETPANNAWINSWSFWTLGVGDTDPGAGITPTDRGWGWYSQFTAVNACDLSFWVGDPTTNWLRMRLTDAGQLQLNIQGSGGGLLIGNDVSLYRSAADTLSTADAFEIALHLAMVEQAGDPANVANQAILYSKDDGGVTKMYYRMSDGTVVGPLTDVGALHAPVTLGGGSDPALALVGQQLTLADVLTPAEHTAIGAAAPHHAQLHGAADHNAAVLAAAFNENLGAFYLDIDDIAVPANPAATIRRLFVDNATGQLSVRTAAGVTVSLEAGGVHNLLDGATHPDTVAQACSRGSLIYGTSGLLWDELIVGAAGTFLRADGADVYYGLILDADIPAVHSGTAHHAQLHAAAQHNAAVLTAGFNEDLGAFYMDMGEIAAPANPAANKLRVYAKDDGGGTTGLALRDSAGVETLVVTRTRYKWIPATDFRLVLGAPTLSDVGGWPNSAYGWWLRNNFTDGIQAHFELPADYVPGTAIKFYLLHGSGGAGNFWSTIQWAAITANNTETMAQTGDATATFAIPANANATLTYAAIDITPTAGDFINMVIARSGAHANDTSANNMVVFGVRVSYTAFF